METKQQLAQIGWSLRQAWEDRMVVSNALEVPRAFATADLLPHCRALLFRLAGMQGTWAEFGGSSEFLHDSLIPWHWLEMGGAPLENGEVGNAHPRLQSGILTPAPQAPANRMAAPSGNAGISSGSKGVGEPFPFSGRNRTATPEGSEMEGMAKLSSGYHSAKPPVGLEPPYLGKESDAPTRLQSEELHFSSSSSKPADNPMEILPAKKEVLERGKEAGRQSPFFEREEAETLSGSDLEGESNPSSRNHPASPLSGPESPRLAPDAQRQGHEGLERDFSEQRQVTFRGLEDFASFLQPPKPQDGHSGLPTPQDSIRRNEGTSRSTDQREKKSGNNPVHVTVPRVNSPAKTQRLETIELYQGGAEQRLDEGGVAGSEAFAYGQKSSHPSTAKADQWPFIPSNQIHSEPPTWESLMDHWGKSERPRVIHPPQLRSRKRRTSPVTASPTLLDSEASSEAPVLGMAHRSIGTSFQGFDVRKEEGKGQPISGNEGKANLTGEGNLPPKTIEVEKLWETMLNQLRRDFKRLYGA